MTWHPPRDDEDTATALSLVVFGTAVFLWIGYLFWTGQLAL